MLMILVLKILLFGVLMIVMLVIMIVVLGAFSFGVQLQGVHFLRVLWPRTPSFLKGQLLKAWQELVRRRRR